MFILQCCPMFTMPTLLKEFGHRGPKILGTFRPNLNLDRRDQPKKFYLGQSDPRIFGTFLGQSDPSILGTHLGRRDVKNMSHL